METALLIYIAVIVTVNLGVVLRGNSKFIPDFYINGNSMTKEDIVHIKDGGEITTQKAVKKRRKGAIIMPTTDLEEAQQRVIEANTAQGRDTKLSELSPE